jgi:hypothetical protein
MRVMPWLGGYRAPVSHAKPLAVAHPVADKAATDYGSEYRGVGVLTGGLGVAIVFAAIAPGAFAVEDLLVLRCFGVLKVSMMCLMLFLVYMVGQKSGLKEKWIRARQESERDRYKTLAALIRVLEGERTEQHAAPVVAELSRILLGESGQIHYNHNKTHQYEAIEKAAEGISWCGFFIALICAFMILLAEFHWLHHHSELILGTAFLPALVGGVHGINGFLTVGNLAADHKVMAKNLSESSVALGKLSARDVDQVLQIARATYTRLDGRDLEWIKKTQSGNRLIVG